MNTSNQTSADLLFEEAVSWEPEICNVAASITALSLTARNDQHFYDGCVAFRMFLAINGARVLEPHRVSTKLLLETDVYYHYSRAYRLWNENSKSPNDIRRAYALLWLAVWSLSSNGYPSQLIEISQKFEGRLPDLVRSFTACEELSEWRDKLHARVPSIRPELVLENGNADLINSASEALNHLRSAFMPK